MTELIKELKELIKAAERAEELEKKLKIRHKEKIIEFYKWERGIKND